MLGRSSDRAAIEAEIDRVRSLGLDELRTLWRATLRSSPPPGLTKDLVARFLCWHIQEQALGGFEQPFNQWKPFKRPPLLAPLFPSLGRAKR